MKVRIGKLPKGPKPQKVDIEIDRYDTWNMAETLAHIIYPMLIKLREEKHGYPSDFVEIGGEDYVDQKSFDFYSESAKDFSGTGEQRWNDILDKMIWSFGQLIDDSWEQQYHHGKAEYDWVESSHMYPNPVTGVMEPTFQMVDKNPTEHWYDFVGHKLHNDRIQEGLDLFGKYYRNLWD